MNMLATTTHNTASGMDAETLLKTAHIKILNDRRTAALGAAILLGESSITDDVPTAATNGRDKVYGREFMDQQTLPQAVYIALHENLHVLKMDITRHRDLTQEDARLSNVAMDYVVNNIIEELIEEGVPFIARPASCEPPYDVKFRGWDVRQVYEHLRREEEEEEEEGKGKPQPMDAHDEKGDGQSMTRAEEEQLEQDIRTAIHQASVMAGAGGGSMPRQVLAAVAPEVRWADEMQEFVSDAMRGDDDITFRRYDRRYITEEIYYPTTHTERVGELLLCMDTSGSTYGPVLDEFIGAFKAMVDIVRPEWVRVLHWDDGVRREDILTEEEYTQDDLSTVLQPIGGGGTCVTRVSDYIIEHSIQADVCLVFTDGYIEYNPQWQVAMPTLWLVTRREGFTAPGNGRVLKVRATS